MGNNGIGNLLLVVPKAFVVAKLTTHARTRCRRTGTATPRSVLAAQVNEENDLEVVNGDDPLGRPAQRDRLLPQRVLAGGGFGVGQHLTQRGLAYLLTELPEGAVQFRGRAVVGLVMVPVRDRQRRRRPGSHVVDRGPGRPAGPVRRCVAAVAATRSGGR